MSIPMTWAVPTLATTTLLQRAGGRDYYSRICPLILHWVIPVRAARNDIFFVYLRVLGGSDREGFPRGRGAERNVVFEQAVIIRR
jgi:hypothetical protein